MEIKAVLKVKIKECEGEYEGGWVSNTVGLSVAPFPTDQFSPSEPLIKRKERTRDVKGIKINFPSHTFSLFFSHSLTTYNSQQQFSLQCFIPFHTFSVIHFHFPKKERCPPTTFFVSHSISLSASHKGDMYSTLMCVSCWANLILRNRNEMLKQERRKCKRNRKCWK